MAESDKAMETGSQQCQSLSPPLRKGLSRDRKGKSRSLYGVNPSSQLGPKAALCQGATLTIQDPSAQKLVWCKAPLSVLVIRKPGDCDIHLPYKNVIEYLVMKNMMVYVEEGTITDLNLPSAKNIFQFNSQTDKESLTGKVDFIVTLGGDGTLIHASSLFQQSVPPILAFNMGSLGFLTPFEMDSLAGSIDKALAGDVALTLRSRLKCVMGAKETCNEVPHIKHLENGTCKQSELNTFSVVNEVVIDRGPSPYLSHIELYVDRKYVTSVQGDGLIISTPTGSTAYAAAAGASMMHPAVPAILVVPVCAHSLSFRPIVLPAGVEITIKVAEGARNTAWAAFDGRNRTELKHGELLRITTSIYPLPSISRSGQLNDWFESLAECLHWNVRRSQKSLSATKSDVDSLSSADIPENSSYADLADSGRKSP